MAAHGAYRQTEAFKAIQATAQQIYTGQPKHVFVNFSDTTQIFSAPVTEFVTFTLKEGASIDKLEPLVTQLQTGLVGTPSFYGSSWAPVIDQPNVIYGVLGWESVQVILTLIPLSHLLIDYRHTGMLLAQARSRISLIK